MFRVRYGELCEASTCEVCCGIPGNGGSCWCKVFSNIEVNMGDSIGDSVYCRRCQDSGLLDIGNSDSWSRSSIGHMESWSPGYVES